MPTRKHTIRPNWTSPPVARKFFPAVKVDGETVRPRRHGTDSHREGFERWELRDESAVRVLWLLALPNGTSDADGLARLGVKS